jgi:hypothetical protein
LVGDSPRSLRDRILDEEWAERWQLLRALFGVVALLATMIAYYHWRDRPDAARVRLVLDAHEVERCTRVAAVMARVGSPNPNKLGASRGRAEYLRDAEIDLKMRAAAAGGNTVLIVERGHVVRGEAYRCGADEASAVE